MGSDGQLRRWPLVLAGIVLCFLLISLQTVHELQEAPPEQFRAVRVAPGIDRQRWSNLYWERARFVQWHYGYGKRLPEEPAEEFRISEERTLPDPVAEQTRRAYWKELQEVWLTAEPWKVSYSIDFGWIGRAVMKAVDGILEFVKGLWPSAHR
jgi:hypothetical protein